MKKKIFAIILARGGSKGIKNKNLKKIKDKPLLKWTIDHCKNSKYIDEIWLSSDSSKILRLGKKSSINIIKRPKKFALDKSSSEEAWLHAISYIEKKNIIACQFHPEKSQENGLKLIKHFMRKFA